LQQINQSSNKSFRCLVVSRASPFTKSGSGVVAKNFMDFFSKNEMIFLCEKNNQIKENHSQVHYINPYPIEISRGKRFIRWQRWFLLKSLINKINLLVSEEKCQSIICFYPDEFYLIASSIVAKKNSIPIYPYFHNLYYENKNGFSAIIAKIVQKKLFNQAPWVYLISEGLLSEISHKYPNINFRVLLHTAEIKDKLLENKIIKKDITQISFLGNINNSNKDALSFFINSVNAIEGIRVNLITSQPKHILKKEKLLNQNVIVKANLSDEEVINELDSSDLLVLPHGYSGPLSNSEYRSAFPTKTINYLQSGTPILALIPENSYLHDFLSKNQCAFCITNKNKQAIFSAIKDIKTNKKKVARIRKNAIKTVLTFSKNKILLELKRQILS
jgi:glycosyltransferase involved in cell wall biosynthesis